MFITNARLINFTTLIVSCKEISSFEIDKFKIINGELHFYTSELKIKDDNLIINIRNEINIKKSTYIIYDGSTTAVSYNELFSSEEFHNKYFTDSTLGISYTKDFTDFYLWSPVASFVNLLIYENGDSSFQEKPKKFKMIETRGLWHTKVKGNLKGYFYTYELKIYEEINETIDPYAKAVGINGHRGAIVDLKDTDPNNFATDLSPILNSPTDAVIYEISIRDISIHPDSNIKNKGKYLGLVEEGTCSSKGVSTGLQHIKDLGVTHLQIMPFFDFSDSSVDEKNPFKYNWGYNPENYNVPEGSYSTDPFYPLCRIYELKKMIHQLHKSKIGVIMDVVYNHVFLHTNHSFHKAFPGYYFRYDDNGLISNGSGCGNDIASERSMVRKYIVDSVLYWAGEYHIDGFRFDLMGLLDIDTMNQIKENLKELNPNILIYGEGWDLGTLLNSNVKATLKNSEKMPNIGYFNDVIRDALKGSVFNDKDTGFVNGKNHIETLIKYCITSCSLSTGHFKPIFNSPEKNINYTSCHDNLTLWDKLQASCPGRTEEDIKAMHILADGIVLTSQGVPFIHGGADFCRTKNGIENSYNSTDNINRMDWHRKFKYKDVFDYYAGLIKLRKEHPAFRMRDIEDMRNHIVFIGNTPANSLAYILKDNANGDSWNNIAVIYNANNTFIKISIPHNHWNITVNRKHSGITPIKSFTNNIIEVEPLSITVLYSE